MLRCCHSLCVAVSVCIAAQMLPSIVRGLQILFHCCSVCAALCMLLSALVLLVVVFAQVLPCHAFGFHGDFITVHVVTDKHIFLL